MVEPMDVLAVEAAATATFGSTAFNDG